MGFVAGDLFCCLQILRPRETPGEPGEEKRELLKIPKLCDNNWGFLCPPSPVGSCAVPRGAPGMSQCPPWLCSSWRSQTEGILIGFPAEPDRAYSGRVMKTDDPILVLVLWGKGKLFAASCRETPQLSIHP